MLENVLLPLGDFALGTTYIQELKLQRKYLKMNFKELQALQIQKLQRLCKHAAKKSPYYQQFQNVLLNAHVVEDLRALPVLTKKQLRENLDDILTVQKASKGLQTTKTSGSTGPHTIIYYNKREISVPRAIATLWWEWAGYQFGNTVIQTGITASGRSLEKRLKDFFLNTRYLPSFAHGEQQILFELKSLQRSPADHFFGYASSIYLFALMAKKNGINNIRFQSISSLGEMLLPQFRETIENVFQTKVYNTYGSSEGLMIAAECEKGSMHQMIPHVIVEILDDQNNEVGPGETGRVVVTGLDNSTTPLIRYEIGDRVKKAESAKCTCGNPYPLLGEVLGRATEFLKTPAGNIITVQTIIRLMKQVEGIDQFRLVQRDANEFVLEYKPGLEFNISCLETLKSFFSAQLNEVINLKFTQVDKMATAPSGKIQLIKNEMKESELV